MKNPGEKAMTPTTVDLLRHGELSGGIRYRGTTEAELTHAGRQAMDAVWTRLSSQVDAIICSPLGRCRGPAEAWSAQSGVPCEVVDDFREMHYGAWEGLTPDEIRRRFPGMLARWQVDPAGVCIPGAESIVSFSGRVVAAWDAMLHRHAGRRTLLVGHSGTLRMILAHILGAPLSATRRFMVPYAAWSRVRESECGCLITYLNRHLDA
jgi:alpha-ribazole phosphatase